jgi:hypothetical protein
MAPTSSIYALLVTLTMTRNICCWSDGSWAVALKMRGDIAADENKENAKAIVMSIIPLK